MNERGYTIVELVVASAVLLGVMTAVTTLLHDGLAAAPMIDEHADLQQRARVSFDRLSADIAQVAAGPRGGPLTRVVAAVLPRAGGAAAASANDDVLSVRYVPPHGAESTLRDPLPPGVESVAIESADRCPRNTVACGFTAGSAALLVDDSGQSDVVAVDAIAPGVLTVRDIDTPRTATYPAGARIMTLAEVTYTLDSATRQLRRREGGGSFPLADNVTELRFEYFDAAFVRLPLTSLVDGPFRGAGRMAFDADLLRIRTVRASVRLDTGVDAFRGRDVRVFRRPGTATGPRHVPDLIAAVDVAVRNGGR